MIQAGLGRVLVGVYVDSLLMSSLLMSWEDMIQREHLACSVLSFTPHVPYRYNSYMYNIWTITISPFRVPAVFSFLF